MVGIIIPILQLSKTEAVYLLISRRVNDFPKIMQVENGKDFLIAFHEKWGILLCHFAMLPLVAFFIM